MEIPVWSGMEFVLYESLRGEGEGEGGMHHDEVILWM